MRLNRTTAAAALAAVLLTGVAPAYAAPAPQPRASQGNDCVAEGQTGLYLSRAGDATVTFSKEWLAGLSSADITSTATSPNQFSDDGKTMTLSIGEDYDNIELPSAHVCYPGSMIYTNPDTGATYELKDFWAVFSPLPANVSEFYTYPIINGVRSSKRVVFAYFSTPQGIADIRIKPGGGIGPNAVKFYTAPDFVRQFNQVLGTDVAPGAPYGTLSINWKGIPSAGIPNTPATAGLQLMANAIRPGLS